VVGLAIPPAFLAQVRDQILPATHDAGDVAARFAPYGGTVLRCAFTPSQADKLAKRLAV
jgi:hypothetical protein